MTGQDLLDRMEILDQELQLQSGEANVTKGLLALNIAQDVFEARLAYRSKTLGSGTGTVTTAASTETTAFPAGLLRIDRMQLLDTTVTPNRPRRELTPLRRAGGHAWARFWPLNIVSSAGTGEPQGYWTNGTSIYWAPLPDGVNTVRWYGLSAAANVTAAGTFAYPDIVALPLAAYAVRLFKSGLDDSADDASLVSDGVFRVVLDALGHFQRDGAVGFEYTAVHDT